MKRAFQFIFISIAVSVLLQSDSLAAEKYLKTEEATTAEVQGVYTLILYESRHLNVVETVAILDREGDPYIFELYAPEFNYTVKNGLLAKEALQEAEKFVSWHSSFWKTQLSRVLDYKGNAIGYELKPLYHLLTFGVSDVLDIYYLIRDNKVVTRIRLIPSVEKRLFDLDRMKGIGK
ncbi:MAG: hypothetical protein QMD01_03990 [Thermodesulfovibrionales bacterium]|nr:hypothetical protein [Thermodesulfovibrionales bacterium]